MSTTMLSPERQRAMEYLTERAEAMPGSRCSRASGPR